MSERGPLRPLDCERGLQGLLEAQPMAAVGAVREDGSFVAPPPGSPLEGMRLLPGRSLIDLVVPGDRAAVVTAWLSLPDEGMTRVPVRFPDGAEAVAHFFDVTERWGVAVVVVVGTGVDGPGVAETEFHAPRPKLAIVGKDMSSTFVEIDAALSSMLGWKPEEIIGRRSLEFIHPDDQDRAVAMWMEMLAGADRASRFRARHRCADGSWLWLEVTNHNHLDDPARGTVLSEMLDVSEEMAALDAVREREQLLTRLADALPVGIFHLSAEATLVYTNDRLWSILGHGTGATFGEVLAALDPSCRGAVEHSVRVVLAEGTDVDLEVEVRREGELLARRCTMTLRALGDHDGSSAGAVGCLADVTEAARLRDELERRASTDVLTACCNRAATLASLEEAVADGDEVAVIFIDLDDFKAVNDHLGHATGDQLLSAAAGRIRGAVRGEDVVGRLGGDEFLIVCPSLTDDDELATVAARIGEALQQPFVVGGTTIECQASVGVASTASGPASADELIARADAQMYESKRARASR